MNAVLALQVLARRWASLHGLQPGALLTGGRLIDREARARNQCIFVARGLTGASYGLIGEAFDITLRSALLCRARHEDRAFRAPTVEAITSMMVQRLARDEVFLDELLAAVAQEEARRRAAADRARANALYTTSQKPGFEIGRRVALANYFADGGSERLAARNRADAQHPEDPISVSVIASQPLA